MSSLKRKNLSLNTVQSPLLGTAICPAGGILHYLYNTSSLLIDVIMVENTPQSVFCVLIALSRCFVKALRGL